ncbi:MAG TPA: HAMP domain-containing sensor histidine kinase [Myxococcota bacterium]|nr:HAMP domain-containing sensor histidine kinase [Myxococcota bacterium]
MNRSCRLLFLVYFLSLAGIGCAAGLGIGMWSLLGQAAVSQFLLRALVVLAIVLLLAALAATLLSRAITRPVDEMRLVVEKLGREDFRVGQGSSELLPLSALASELRELGVFLEERDRKNTAEAQARARLQNREALQRFGRGVAREVQKSLAGVVGYTEIALRQPGVEGQLKNYLTLMDQEARSGREALERILRCVRDEDFPTESLDVNSLLLDTSRSFTDGLEKEKVTMKLNMAQDLPRVMGDAGQLRYVLTALVTNAREAMLPEGGTLELSTNTNNRQHVVVMVKDTGHGIAEADQPRLFTPFFTTKGNRKGAGLSLSIVERIVNQHAGAIEFWSKPGQGSVFFVTIPPAQADGGVEAGTPP